MRAFGYLDHVGVDGLGPLDRLMEAGVVPHGWGENIARGASTDEIVAAWMDSPEHRANILLPGFTHVGTAVSGSGGSAYCTQVFLTIR
jgi:uncharacterized protein YkwD